ncbi:MAG: GyrI-like domain-containing protein [Chloroflexota bacterium]
MTSRNYLEIHVVDVRPPLIAVCKEFLGPYERTSDYVGEVQSYLGRQGRPYHPEQVLSIHFDRPREQPPEALRSFQGVFVDGPIQVQEPYFLYRLEGRYVQACIRADQPEQYAAAYAALLAYASSNGLNVISETGIQVTLLEGEQAYLEIYLELGAAPSPA